jgi:hypothetical protein
MPQISRASYVHCPGVLKNSGIGAARARDGLPTTAARAVSLPAIPGIRFLLYREYRIGREQGAPRAGALDLSENPSN